MVIFGIKIDNYCGFSEFAADFSYPKKIVNSSLGDEHLEGYEKMRYRKINILSGANASGKTSFGKVLNAVFVLIGNKNPSMLQSLIASRSRDAEIEMDFHIGSKFIYRINIKCEGVTNPEQDSRVLMCIRYVPLRKEDTYEKCSERLSAIPLDYTDFDGSALAQFGYFGWNFTFTDQSNSFKSALLDSDLNFLFRITDAVLRTLDPSISEIIPVDDKNAPKAFILKFKDSDAVVITNEGTIMDPRHVLSKGTEKGLEIISLISSVLEHKNGFYYCDEKFSYIQSDVEKAILSVLIDHIRSGEQLFFTTHNLDLMDMDLPKHSFSFFRKDTQLGKSPIQLIHADEYIKKNNVSLRNAVENDLFNSTPDISRIFDLNSLAE